MGRNKTIQNIGNIYVKSRDFYYYFWDGEGQNFFKHNWLNLHS